MTRPILSDTDHGGVARIYGLPNGVQDQEPATVGQLKAMIEGLAWKDNVRVATQANLNLASPGATIDGITMALNDRVLIRSQTTASENGIYLWNGASSAMTRSADASTADELESAVTTVDEGTSAGATYRQTLVNFTIGSGAINFSPFGTAAGAATEAAAGIVELATQAETDAGTDDQRAVTPLKLATYAGRAKRYSATIGDGSALSYVVTHNIGTKDVIVQVYRVSDGVEVLADVTRGSTTSVTIGFASAPSTNQYRVVVLG